LAKGVAAPAKDLIFCESTEVILSSRELFDVEARSCFSEGIGASVILLTPALQTVNGDGTKARGVERIEMFKTRYTATFVGLSLAYKDEHESKD